MELKVRVDGIPRIVCGVTESTTCQDVVIALAHAMGRTGTFTLIEKWRDSERPLNKSEFPVKVLQKWGEYANEVQLLLQNSDKLKQSEQQDSKNEVVKSKENFKHNFSPTVAKEGPVRRSLTFSGVHNSSLPQGQREGQKPANKLQNISEKENLDNNVLTQSLPTYGFLSKQTIGKPQTLPNNPPPPFPHSVSQQPYAQIRKISRNQNATSQLYSTHQKANQPHSHNQQPHSHYQHSKQPQSQFQQNSQPHFQNQQKTQPHSQIQQNSQPHFQNQQKTQHQHKLQHHFQPQHSSHYMHHSNQPKSYVNNSPESHMLSQSQSSPRNDGSKFRHFNGDLNENNQALNRTQAQSKYSPVHSRTGSRSPSKSPNKIGSPVSPTDSRGQSPSLSLYNRNRQSAFSPVVPRQKSPNSPKNLVNGDLDFRVYSPEREGSDLVEYDLDSNFPDLYSEKRLNSGMEEYQMPGEPMLSSPVQEVIKEDTEFLKMQELVTRQQERIKHQESQLDVINSEISSLEKKDAEQDEELVKLSEEKVLLEQKHKQFESELSKLESTKWVDLVQAERQSEAKIRSEIMEFKSWTTKISSELKSLQGKLTSLEKDIDNEKNVLKEEKDKRELEEKQLQEEVDKVRIEIKSLSESNDSDKLLIVKIENELQEVNDDLTKQKTEVESLEQELIEANMKDFKQVTPMGGDKGKLTDSGEVVLKVLEGRKSPIIGMGRKMISSPLSQILAVSKNPNGVWV